MTKKRKERLGIFLIFAPFFGLVLILSAYAVANFAISSIASNQPDQLSISPDYFDETERDDMEDDAEFISDEDVADGEFAAEIPAVDEGGSIQVVIGNIINVFLGALGVLAVLGMFVLPPIGLWMVMTSHKKSKK